MCKLNEDGKQTRSVNFVQTVGTNDCFSTEPVISICFFGGVGGSEALYGARVDRVGPGYFCKRSGTVQWLLVIIQRIQSIKVEKMSLMTNEIKCYICMISCIFIELIFMVVYTEWMYY